MRLAVHLDADSPLAIAWQECACVLCGGGYLTPLLEAPDVHSGLRFLIARCNRCGLAYTNPRPDEVSIEQFYPQDYRCHRRKNDSPRLDVMGRLLANQAPAR